MEGPDIRDKVPRELLEEAIPAAQWVGGKGREGLRMAEKIWQKEMDTRQQIPGPKYPWMVEGHLDDQIVYRKHSVGGNVPSDLDAIPEGREKDVNYNVVSYKISA